MTATQWFTGPQLIGFIMLSAGFIQQTFPPKDISGSYGYRTTRSRRNQQTFDEGNRYSAKLIMFYGFIALVAGLIVTPFIDKSHEYIRPILTVGTTFVIALSVILKTEKHLKRMFDNNEE